MALRLSYSQCRPLRVWCSPRYLLRVWYSQRVSMPWEYQTLSVDWCWDYDTLSVARWAYNTLRVSYFCCREPELRVILSAWPESIILSAWMATSTESMILSAWHAESIILSALLSASAENIGWEYNPQPALWVILSECLKTIIHSENMILSVPLWVYAESISAHWEYYSQPALRVILSACPERCFLHKHGWTI